jgi:hypothetical protein
MYAENRTTPRPDVDRRKLAKQVCVNLSTDDHELLVRIAHEYGVRRAGAMARILLERALDAERVAGATEKQADRETLHEHTGRTRAGGD